MKLLRKLLFSSNLVRLVIADCKRSLEEQRQKHRRISFILRGGSIHF